MKKRFVAAALTVAMAASLMTGCVKVVKIGEEGKLTGVVEFDAASNIEEVWETNVVPECEEKAVDITEVLSAGESDLKALGEECGGTKDKSAANYTYCVKVEGATIAEVDKDSYYGTMTLTIPDYAGKITVSCEIGQYKSTAIRDNMSFLNFGDFKNQTEWNQINLSMLSKVDEAVVQPVYDSLEKGATVDIIACFTADSADKIVLSPVVLTVK